MRRAQLLLALGLIVAAGVGCGGREEQAAPPEAPAARPRAVTLALDFTPNGVHAGIYAAVAEGRDRAAGVRLRVRTPSASTDSLKLLAANRADASIVDIHDLGLARERRADVVGVGALVQRPLAAVIARPGASLTRPRELEGRRVGVTGLPSDDAVLDAIVAADGGDPRRVRRTTIGFTAVPALIARRVDAATAFWSAEGVALRRRGIATEEFRVDRFGVPAYPELIVCVRGATLRRDPELVRRLVAALRAGTAAALARPDAPLDALVRASGADRELVRAQLAAVRPALTPPLRLDRPTLERWARFDASSGILRRPPAVGDAFAFAPGEPRGG